MNDILFKIGNGGLGSIAPGTDYISGYLIYSSTIPSGFTNSTVKLITSLNQAVSYGILGDYSDETKAVATLVASATGSVGDLVTINVTEPSLIGTNVVSIPYTRKTSDTTDILLASSIANTINSSGTGYTSVAIGATISVTARAGMGASLNSGTPVAIVDGGTAAVTISAQFTGGVASKLIEWHYQLSEFYRMSPNATIYVAFYPTGDTLYANIVDMVAQSNGNIKQLMVTSTSTSTSQMLSDIDLIQSQCSQLQTQQTPISVLYSNNLFSTTDLSTLPNLRAKSDNYTSVVIGQDAGGLGAWLSLTMGRAITTLGACLGTVALSNVDEDIAWTQFNISNGAEDEIVGFMNGQVWKSSNISIYNQIDNYGYIFLRKFANIAGSFWNDSHTCTSITSDFAYIERNRVISKAQRGSYADLFPLLNGPIYFNNDGTLANVTVATYEQAPMATLETMKKNGEISNFKVIVDTVSNVQQTGILNITVEILGVGISRHIVCRLGYAKTI